MPRRKLRLPRFTNVAYRARAFSCAELSRLSDDRGFLIGDSVTLADVYAAPILACFTQAPEAVLLMEGCEKLNYWWRRFTTRDSMFRTQP
ncbi:glutathione S-transferase domain-containing protein [Paraburkholderia fungorum]|uniref:glutathione S-transferase family protein n=1 Tax=Paraburkholderia fungorum TaxID=134537 RepID=UPI0038BA7270